MGIKSAAPVGLVLGIWVQGDVGSESMDNSEKEQQKQKEPSRRVSACDFSKTASLILLIIWLGYSHPAIALHTQKHTCTHDEIRIFAKPINPKALLNPELQCW